MMAIFRCLHSHGTLETSLLPSFPNLDFTKRKLTIPIYGPVVF